MQTITQLPGIPLASVIAATLVFSFGFSILRLHKRFGRKTRYALRLSYTRSALVGYAVLSGILSLFLSLVTQNRIGVLANTIAGAVLLAFSSSLIIAGATSVMGVKSKDQKSLVTIATWVYETIDPEIERLVHQEMVDIAMRLKGRPNACETLFEVGRSWVAINPQFEKRKVRIQLLERIDEFSAAGVGDGVLVRYVGFLINDCECDPEWIEKKVRDGSTVNPPYP
jgi:hypothetical protein